jgi:hypothetical protein
MTDLFRNNSLGACIRRCESAKAPFKVFHSGWIV